MIAFILYVVLRVMHVDGVVAMHVDDVVVQEKRGGGLMH